MKYSDFIDSKSQFTSDCGFDVEDLPSCMFDFQQHLVRWALRRGRAAIFADCGLGKTLMQLVWAQKVVERTNRRVLILTPLAVAQQTVREAEKFGIEASRSAAGELNAKIVVTNYDRLHHFNPVDFAGFVCDESSILKNVSGETRQAITRFTLKTPFRLLCTATAAPNDYVELGTSSEALGELSHSDMLRRFFRQLDDKGQKKAHKQQQEAERLIEQDPQYFGKLAFRVAQTIGQWRLKNHAVDDFWRWVASWARACRMPSDLGFDDGKFILPELIQRDHLIVPDSPPPGYLINVPAKGMQAERNERSRNLEKRCKYVADLVDHDQPAVVWCQANPEADLLEKIIPNALQVAGRHDDEYKTLVENWFRGEICICNLPEFRARLATWQKQKDRTDIGLSTIESIVRSGLLNLRSIQKKIETSEKSICPNTTGRTKTSTRGRKSRTLSVTESEERSTQLTKSSGSTRSNLLKSIGLEGQTLELLGRCRSMDQLLMSICDLLNLDVQSADQEDQVIRGVIDYISITITTQEGSEAYFALTAILGSESFETIRNSLMRRHCICGHASGKRKLITKSKIFGHGLNWQHCNHVVSFASHSYEQMYQSVRRCYRFGQTRPVTFDLVATEGEELVIGNVKRKADQAEKMFEKLVEEMARAVRVERENIYTKKAEVPSWLTIK